MTDTITLGRPTGPHELALVASGGGRELEASNDPIAGLIEVTLTSGAPG